LKLIYIFHLRPFIETGKPLKDVDSISRDMRRLKGMIAAKVLLRRFTATSRSQLS
jgi:hypothetical protein